MVSISRETPYLDYQKSITILAKRIRELRVEAFEAGAHEGSFRELHPKTTTLLHQANEIVHQLIDADETPEIDLGASLQTSSTPTFGSEVAASAAAFGRIADVAFVAQVELRQRAEQIAELGNNGPEILVTECDGALRRVLKALGALDEAIAHACNAVALLDFKPDLDISLRTRASYAQFRSRVLKGGETVERDEDVEARLRAACFEIATLVGSPLYPKLRIYDRIQFRGLQQRIVRWASNSPCDMRDGLSLWADVCAFASILRDVNRRQDLSEHDGRVLRQTTQCLFGATDGEMPSRTMDDLRSLRGRDDELDMLVASGTRKLEAWGPVLKRVASEMGIAVERRLDLQ